MNVLANRVLETTDERQTQHCDEGDPLLAHEASSQPCPDYPSSSSGVCVSVAQPSTFGSSEMS
jgi:hypothetical protein